VSGFPPQLQTQRLLLRGLRDDDLDAYASMVADPEVMRYLGVGEPVDRATAWRQLAMFAGHWVLRGYGLWALERRADGAFVGRAGLWQPEGWPGLEVGWALTRDAWGHGYATEAARAACEWAWSELGAQRLISVIAPDNEPSIRVALRLGMRHVRDEEIHGRVCRIYGLDRAAA
jgi:RimJ/RimL family protein N-acetyltransferase